MLKLSLHEADLDGRICAPVPSLQGVIECCLPCPIADWVYTDRKLSKLMNGEYKLIRLFQISKVKCKLRIGSTSLAWSARYCC